jgi:hypothetical protein
MRGGTRREWRAGDLLSLRVPVSLTPVSDAEFDSCLLRGPKQPSQQSRINPAAEANLALNLDDRHTLIESRLEVGTTVNVHLARFQSVRLQHCLGIIAQMAATSRVNDNMHELPAAPSAALFEC